MIKTIELAKYLGLDLLGPNVLIRSPSSIESNDCNSVFFASTYSNKYLNIINNRKDCMVITIAEYGGLLHGSYVISNNPRLDFCRILNAFFGMDKKPQISKSAIIGERVTLGVDIFIGENVVIENDVCIGGNTVIMHNVVISSNTTIGNKCVIKSGSIIGQRGFGFERDDHNTPLPMVHYASVTIGDNVEIGALNTIAAGVFSDTIIEDHVKTDDHVHLAHNVYIKSGALIAACTEISGSVHVGENVWIGPNSSILDKLTIGDGAFIGISSNVTKSVASGCKVAGNPARRLSIMKEPR